MPSRRLVCSRPQDGACAVGVWIVNDTVLVANVGDAKCVLARVSDKVRVPQVWVDSSSATPRCLQVCFGPKIVLVQDCSLSGPQSAPNPLSQQDERPHILNRTASTFVTSFEAGLV